MQNRIGLAAGALGRKEGDGNGQYIRYDAIPPGMEAQFDFAKETADNIVEFLLSDRIPVEGKNRVLGRPYLSIPMADGTVWKPKKFD